MSDILNKLALSQVCMILRDTLKSENSDIVLPEDLPDKMFRTMCQGEANSLVSVRDVLPCRIPLPFMPDRIDYKIGKGCCDEIVKRDGLFVPCSHHCDDGFKCSKHLKEPSGCGDYQERYAAWNKKELYCVVIGEKEIKEKPYGTYLHSKSLDSIAIEEELRKWGIPLRLDFTQWRAPPKPLKKNRGRKAVLKVTPSESDSDQYESDEELKGVKEATKDEATKDEATKEDPDSEPEEPEAEPEEPEAEPEDPDAVPEVKEKKRPAPKKTKKSESDSDPEAETKEKKRPAPKKKEKVKGTPLDAELKKEEMEEKAPKKGKYRGKKDLLVAVKWNEEDYFIKDGRYYAPETLELVAWTKTGGEIILL
jgi:hypothetical protein